MMTVRPPHTTNAVASAVPVHQLQSLPKLTTWRTTLTLANPASPSNLTPRSRFATGLRSASNKSASVVP